jgi:hypothetical protein
VRRAIAEVFAWALSVLADRGLLKGKRIAVDASTLEADAQVFLAKTLRRIFFAVQ